MHAVAHATASSSPRLSRTLPRATMHRPGAAAVAGRKASRNGRPLRRPSVPYSRDSLPFSRRDRLRRVMCASRSRRALLSRSGGGSARTRARSLRERWRAAGDGRRWHSRGAVLDSAPTVTGNGCGERDGTLRTGPRLFHARYGVRRTVQVEPTRFDWGACGTEPLNGYAFYLDAPPTSRYGPEAHLQGVGRPGQGPAGQLFCRPHRRRPLPLAGDHYWPARLALLRRGVLSQHPLPHRLPVQAAQGAVHHQDLPPEYQFERIDMPGYPPRPVVAGAHHIQGAAVDLLAVDRPQPRRSPGAGYRPQVQE
eukprot:ctg_2557.g375